MRSDENGLWLARYEFVAEPTKSSQVRGKMSRAEAPPEGAHAIITRMGTRRGSGGHLGRYSVVIVRKHDVKLLQMIRLAPKNRIQEMACTSNLPSTQKFCGSSCAYTFNENLKRHQGCSILDRS